MPDKTVPENAGPHQIVLGPQEIDLTVARAFKAAIDAAGKHARGGTLTLDLSHSCFLDSAGLEAVVRGTRGQRTDGYRLCIRVRAGSQPQKVLRLSRLDTLLTLTISP